MAAFQGLQPPHEGDHGQANFNANLANKDLGANPTEMHSDNYGIKLPPVGGGKRPPQREAMPPVGGRRTRGPGRSHGIGLDR